MLLSRPAAQSEDRGLERRPPEQLAAALARAVPHGICVLDACGVITDVNAALTEMTGFARDTLVGAGMPHPHWPEDERDACAAIFRDGLAGKACAADLVLRRRDGTRFPASLTMSPLAQDGGGGEGLVAVVRETSRETGERALLDEAHHVARLVSWEYDPGSGTVALSRELADVVGSRVPRLTTLDRALELLAPRDAEAMRARLARVGGGDGGTIMESELVQPERNLDWALLPPPRWVETRMRAIRDPSGALTGSVHGTTQDITARKLADLAGRSSEQRLREAQHVGELGSFEIDCGTRLVTWSPQLYRLFDVQAGTCSGDLDFLLGLIPAEDASQLARLADAIAEDGRPRELEHRYLRGSEVRHAETRLQPLDGGVARGVRGTLRDVTARRLAQDEARLRGQLLDAAGAAIIATDLHAIVTHWSRGAEQLYGWSHAETVGRPLRPLTLDEAEHDDGRRLLERVISAGPAETTQELARRDGTRFHGLVRTSRLTDAAGAPSGVAAVAVDRDRDRPPGAACASCRRATRDDQRAITDSMDQGVYTLDAAGRLIHMNRAAQQLLGWSFAELDGRPMHEVLHPGDACPLRPAYEGGVPVRIDDDVLIRKDGGELQVAISASPFRNDDGKLEAVVVFTDIGDRKASERRLLGAVERVSWVGRVRDALDQERFVVYAQPLLDLATGAGAGHELLVRMVDPGGELIAPARFLPAAEQYGLVGDIDRWMLGQAVELAARGHAVAVNLSPRTVAAGRINEDLHTALTGAGADPALLVIELTEATLAGQGPGAAQLIDGIRETGCRLALDHFGTGKGGFTYLRRLPFDYLKIDAEFIRDLPENPASQDVVRAIVELARGFGQRTVAEGVESEGTLDLLHDLGVDLAQGFAIGRPAPAPDVFGSAPGAWRRRSIV